MNIVETTLIMLILLMIIIIGLTLVSKYKKQAVKIYTIESFLNGHHLIENEDQKKNLIDRINDIFDDSKDRAGYGESDDGDDGDDGGDGGE
ncbi:hypothetical protein [Gottfriedia solisilvae]|uniref:hypothetical protein n=1 Tax=Gottfriedia solisilvae TaxID=1516104 RepID=UPI003D2F07A3